MGPALPVWALLATLQPCSAAPVDPGSAIALGGLGLAAVGGLWSGVKGLWAIAKNLGAHDARIATILANMQQMLGDHEDRIRRLEHDP